MRTRRGALFVVPLTLAFFGCKDDPKSDAKADAKAKDSKTADGKKADGKKADTPAGTGGEQAGTVTPAGNTENPPAASASGRLGVFTSVKAPTEPVLGHFVIGNFDAMLKDVKGIGDLGEAGAMLDANALKGLASMGAAEAAPVVQSLDFTKPFGCAVLDSPTLTTQPEFACVIGYTGGAKKMISDVEGIAGGKKDAAGHLAMFEMEGQKAYIDEIGGMVVASIGEATFGKAKQYLADRLVDAKVGNALEVVVYGKRAADAVRKTPFGEIMKSAADLQEDPPGLAGFATKLAKSTSGTNDPLAGLDQLEGMAVRVDVLDGNPRFVFAARSTPDAPGVKVKSVPAAVSPKTLAKLPQDSLVAIAMDSPETENPGAMLEDEFFNSVKKVWAEETGMTEDEVAKIFEDLTSKSMFHPRVGMGGWMKSKDDMSMVFVYEAKEGTDPRTVYDGWFETHTSDKVLGKKYGSQISWSLEKDAAKIGDVPVDTVTLEIDKSALPGDMDWNGEAKLHMAWPAGHMIMAVSNADANKALEKTVEAVAKADGTAFQGPLLTPASDATTVVGVNVRGILDAVGEAEEVKWDGGIDDVVMRARVHSPQESVFEVQVAGRIIPAIIKAAN